MGSDALTASWLDNARSRIAALDDDERAALAESGAAIRAGTVPPWLRKMRSLDAGRALLRQKRALPPPRRVPRPMFRVPRGRRVVRRARAHSPGRPSEPDLDHPDARCPRCDALVAVLAGVLACPVCWAVAVLALEARAA
jgi:hypothetical protein